MQAPDAAQSPQDPKRCETATLNVEVGVSPTWHGP